MKQLLTVKYKLEPTQEQKEHLHNLCSIATKLYNTSNYMNREEWKKTGKIPSWYSSRKPLKDNVWRLLLPSQTADEILHNIFNNYKSWFKLRKSNKSNNPPGFRNKSMLSPLNFSQQFYVNNKINLIMSMKYRRENSISKLSIDFDKWKDIKGKPKICQIVFDKSNWYANIVFEVEPIKEELNDKIMAIDLGIVNTATTINNIGNGTIHKGGQLLSVERYYNKKIGNIQSKLIKQFPKRHKCNRIKQLWEKRNRQINQSLHEISNNIIKEAKENNIKTIVIGDITDIRKGANLGKNNQKLHSWSFSKLTQQIEYKAILSGIRFVRVSEKYTSQTCSCCGTISKNNRITRGLYKCKFCGRTINADINGATNILKKYLQLFPMENKSSCCVAQPKVSLIQNVLSRKSL